MTVTLSRKTATLASLSTSVPQIFNDAQKPNANQRKHAIALRKIHEQCALNEEITEGPHSIDEQGEAAFFKAVITNINKILSIRKREPHADRIVRFIASFTQYTQQLDSKENNEDDDAEEPQETISSRFVEHLMRHLLRGMTAKNKTVRLRCCQIIALSISSLGELDEELYQQLRSAMFARIHDKEPSVRIQAATALARLQSADDEIDPNDGRSITQKLIYLMEHDPSAEVRRVVLFNLDVSRDTLPYIVHRARDVDAINRRVVFLKPMAEIPDFQQLTIQQRHDLLKWGLNDRDPLVKRAASKLLATQWIRHADHNLLEFLERMDVTEGRAAEDILTAFLTARPDIVNTIIFDVEFWNNLSPESAFLARVFIKFLKSTDENKLDEILPEVTRHAFCIQHYNNLWQQATKDTESEYEFIVAQLLEIAKCLDYADEVGRRKMFGLLREILMAPDIPDDHLVSAVEIFKLISLDEHDFTRTMIEIISDIQELLEVDTQEDADGETPAKRLKTDETLLVKKEEEEEGGADPRVLQKMLTQLKCLSICKYTLERCEESLQDNSTLYGLLNDLIVPSVRSKEVVLREEGLHCLGLCCCLDMTLGLHNISLFIHCLQNGHDELQQKALMILFDLIVIYGFSTVLEKIGSMEQFREIIEACLDHDNVDVQSITVEGLAKLMLGRVFNDEEVLKLLVLLYFFPSTGDNQKVQQCLSYFFPVYCYSSPANQKMMSKIAIVVLEELCAVYMDLQQDEEIVHPSQIGDILADWTDTKKLATDTKIFKIKNQEVDESIHGDMAIDALIVINRSTGVVRKAMCHILLKLNVAGAGKEKLQKICELAQYIEKEKPIKETMVRKSFERFVRSVEKLCEAHNEGSNNDSVDATAEAKTPVDTEMEAETPAEVAVDETTEMQTDDVVSHDQ